jgi:hypothetical protein
MTLDLYQNLNIETLQITEPILEKILILQIIVFPL